MIKNKIICSGNVILANGENYTLKDNQVYLNGVFYLKKDLKVTLQNVHNDTLAENVRVGVRKIKGVKNLPAVLCKYDEWEMSGSVPSSLSECVENLSSCIFYETSSPQVQPQPQPITVTTVAQITTQGIYYLDTVDGTNPIGIYHVLADGTVIAPSGSITTDRNTDYYTSNLDFDTTTNAVPVDITLLTVGIDNGDYAHIMCNNGFAIFKHNAGAYSFSGFIKKTKQYHFNIDLPLPQTQAELNTYGFGSTIKVNPGNGVETNKSYEIELVAPGVLGLVEYNSGANTPQVQADYTETDNTLPSFIENKPLPPRNIAIASDLTIPALQNNWTYSIKANLTITLGSSLDANFRMTAETSGGQLTIVADVGCELKTHKGRVVSKAKMPKNVLVQVKREEGTNDFYIEVVKNDSCRIPIGNHEVPSDFPNPLLAEVNYDGTKFTTNVKVSDIDFTKKATHTKYYVDYEKGNNSNDGLTVINAFKTYKKAADVIIASAQPSEIILLDDWIGFISLWSTQITFNNDIKISSKSKSGVTLITQKRESFEGTFNWTDNSDGSFSSNTRQYNYSACFDNKFKDEYGIAKPMRAVNSLLEVSQEKGTFYYDGTNFHIQMFDSREPDGNWIYCGAASSNKIRILNSNPTATVIIENLIFYVNNKTAPSDAIGGRNTNFTGVSPNTSKLGVKNCVAVGSSGNGFAFTDFAIQIYENCKARYNRKDGFNYHSLAGAINGKYITVYEVNCKSINQGFDGYFTQQPVKTTSNNGSTSHDNINVMRVNCVHSYTDGGVIADVGGTYSVNYGVIADFPNRGVADIRNASFWHLEDGLGDAPKGMILIGCSSEGLNKTNETSYTILNENNSNVELKYWKGKLFLENGDVEFI